VNPAEQLAELLARPEPLLALAPMQDITDLPFWTLLAKFGGPDVYYTEFFRVHGTSGLQRETLRSITENPTGRPAIAQMIGNDLDALARIARELQKHRVAGVDLNLGCPAPIVYRKCAGGGLLRDLDRVDAILGRLRQSIDVHFTVKTRVGFDSVAEFPRILETIGKHSPDLVTVHGRTVREMYGPTVHYELIAQACDSLPCPILANGNVDSVESARRILAQTRARGLMIGRGAIRNPWIFDQIRRAFRGEPWFVPSGHELLNYVRELYEAVKPPNLRVDAHVQKMKKYMNFIGVGADPENRFLFEIRRVTSEKEFMATCERFLDHSNPAFETRALAA
jgi:tRNA-dihydrouridine synthase B